jgi:shikimate kinase
MRVLLTGFMGAGKTTVGKRLAEILELPFFDLDEVVEVTAGMSIRRIFETRGEANFRALESEALERMLEAPDAVVATGGGTLVRVENMDRIRGRAVSVWLNTPLDVIDRRLDHEKKRQRPLFEELSEMEDLMEHRLPAYRKADLKIDTDGDESVDEIVSRLIAALEEAACATS